MLSRSCGSSKPQRHSSTRSLNPGVHAVTPSVNLSLMSAFSFIDNLNSGMQSFNSADKISNFSIKLALDR